MPQRPVTNCGGSIRLFATPAKVSNAPSPKAWPPVRYKRLLSKRFACQRRLFKRRTGVAALGKPGYESLSLGAGRALDLNGRGQDGTPVLSAVLGQGVADSDLAEAVQSDRRHHRAVPRPPFPASLRWALNLTRMSRPRSAFLSMRIDRVAVHFKAVPGGHGGAQGHGGALSVGSGCEQHHAGRLPGRG